MKYLVRGTIEYNFKVVVDADSEDAAEREAIERVEDGAIELSDPVDEAKISSIVPYEKAA